MSRLTALAGGAQREAVDNFRAMPGIFDGTAVSRWTPAKLLWQDQANGNIRLQNKGLRLRKNNRLQLT
jgi:hypothetical protein